MQNKDNRITVAGDNNIIIQDAEHGLRSVPKYLTVPPAEPPTAFVGREEALEQLHQSLQSQQRLLLASGIRGIGKTTLAQAYFHKHQSDYQCMAWVNCPSGILQGLLECTIDDSLGFDAQRDNWERHYQLVWKKLANLQGKHLLVLDNANDREEVLRYLKSIPNWTILVTSTATVPNMPTQPVEKLREGPAIQLFCSYYPAALPLEETEELLRRLLNAIGYHTLTIELLAKNLAELRNYSLQNLCDDLEKRGVLQLPKTRAIDAERYHNMTEVNPKDVIREIFDISTLPGNYSNLLLELAMLPAEPLPYEHLRVLLNIVEEIEAEFDQTLKKLSATGWLEHDRAADTYYLHTLIAEVVRDKHHPTYARFAQLADTLENLLDDKTIKLGEKIPYLPYAQSLAQRLPDAELALLCLYACDRYRAIGNLQLGMWFAEEALKRYELKDDQFNISVCYERLGTLWQNKGDFNRALDFFEKRAQLGEELYRDNPQNEKLKNGLAVSYEKLGDLWKNKGDFNRALDFFEKQTHLFEELYRDNPLNENLKNGLAISYSKLGTLWQDKGNFNRALEFFEKETHLFEELYRDNPLNENLKNGLAISYHRLGAFWEAKGNFDEALKYFEQYRQISEDAYNANPHSEKLKNDLAISYSKLGVLWQNKGDFNRALEFFEKYNQLREELYRDNPQNENLKNGLAISYEKLGTLWQNKGDFNKALEFFEKRALLGEELYRDNPQNENLKNGLAISYEKLGTLWQDKGDFNRALDFFEKRAQLGEELYRDNPQNENLKNGLAISYNKLGLLWLAQNDLEKALPHLQKDLQLTEEIAITNPYNMNWQNNLCYSWRDVGEVLEALDRKEEALALYEKAAAGWQALWEQTELPQIKEDLDWVRARIAELSTH